MYDIISARPHPSAGLRAVQAQPPGARGNGGHGRLLLLLLLLLLLVLLLLVVVVVFVYLSFTYVCFISCNLEWRARQAGPLQGSLSFVAVTVMHLVIVVITMTILITIIIFVIIIVIIIEIISRTYPASVIRVYALSL